jgi:hypothetical protein
LDSRGPGVVTRGAGAGVWAGCATTTGFTASRGMDGCAAG